MVKSRFILSVSLIIITAVLILSGCGKKDPYENSKPFENLSSSDVQAVYVVFGNYEPYKLNNEKDVEKFISLVKDIPTYNRDDAYAYLIDASSYCVTFLIKKNDGAKIKIEECGDFFMIDGAGYKSDYDLCNKLGEFFYSFIEEIKENGKLMENN